MTFSKLGYARIFASMIWLGLIFNLSVYSVKVNHILWHSDRSCFISCKYLLEFLNILLKVQISITKYPLQIRIKKYLNLIKIRYLLYLF